MFCVSTLQRPLEGVSGGGRGSVSDARSPVEFVVGAGGQGRATSLMWSQILDEKRPQERPGHPASSAESSFFWDASKHGYLAAPGEGLFRRSQCPSENAASAGGLQAGSSPCAIRPFCDTADTWRTQGARCSRGSCVDSITECVIVSTLQMRKVRFRERHAQSRSVSK